MNHVRWVQTLIRILPFSSGPSRRLRQHLEGCPECLGRMADINEARAATVSSRNLDQAKDFWPGFVQSLDKPAEPKPRPGWSWALGTAGLLALAIIGTFLFVPSPPTDILSFGVKLRVNYVRIYEKPAQAFIFNTQDANSTFVWVERTNPGGSR